MKSVFVSLLIALAFGSAKCSLGKSPLGTQAALEEIHGHRGPASRSRSSGSRSRRRASRRMEEEEEEQRRALPARRRSGRALQGCANIITSTKVDLSNCGLSGDLSGQLLSMGNLSQVSYMDLSGNSFTGPIPSWISNYSSLTLLSLASNLLSGNIPDTLGKLSLLTSLVLGSNLLSGPIPATLGNLTLLVSLDLSYNALTGAIPSSLGNCQALTSVDLSLNSLSSIPASFGNLLSLQSLDLRRNMLTSLPDSLGNMGQLSSLDLARNRLSGPIPDIFGRMSSLTSLILDFNAFTGTLPKSLGQLSQLVTLSAGANRLSGPLPQALGSLPLLTHLELFGNRFSGTIPTWLGALQSLQILDLGSNRLEGTLPDLLANLTNMRFLSLNQNQFTGVIPNFLANLSQLVMLHLDSNQLSGPIPQALQALSQLSRLFLFNNRLTGPVPEFLCQMPALGKIYLYSNQLSGTIPPCLGNLSEMVALDLSGNQLTGPIPSSLGNYDPTQFFALWLNFNNLSGPIPPQLGQLESLTYLDLSNNQLSGPVPNQLGLLSQLQTLSLQNNQLCGPLPGSLNLLTSLETLNAASNLLNGTLSLRACSALAALQLGSNRFVDVTGLPPQLTALDLSQNQLQGQIPAAILQLPVLERLSLSGNALSISLPSSLGSMAQLSELRVRACNLSGTIPAALLALPNLAVLDIQDNPLSGTFPDSSSSSLVELLAGHCSFSSISSVATSVVVLDFSSNMLQAVPPNLGSLHLLGTLKLANNQITEWPEFGVFGRTTMVNDGTPQQLIAYTSPPNVPPLNLQLLQFLDLSNNPLGQGAREVVLSLLYLPNLMYFACSSCQLTGPVSTFYWIDYNGFLRGAAPPLMFKTQVLKQGFPNLASLDLANNSITDLPSEPPPKLLLADFSQNSLSAGGVPKAWFNEGGALPLTRLIASGNSGLRMGVRPPTSGSGSGCDQVFRLTANADNFKSFGGSSSECTALCSTPTTQYVTDIFLDKGNLCRCLPGFQGTALDCTGCPPDTFSSSLASDVFKMQKVCSSCPSGSSTLNLTRQSSLCGCKCRSGTFLSSGSQCETAESATCLPCGDLKTSQPGSLSAQDCRCDLAQVPGLVQLQDRDGTCRCAPGLFLKWSALACSPCTEGQACNWQDINQTSLFLDPPALLPGYWASSAAASRKNFSGHSVFRCYGPATCMDGRGTCAPGRGGKACSLCLPGYFGGPHGSCKQCKTSQAQSQVGFAFAFVLVWPAALGLHVMNQLMIGETAAPQVAAGPAASEQRSTAFQEPALLEEAHQLARKAWVGVVYTAAFQIFQFLQLVSVLTRVEQSLPPASRSLFAGIDIATVSVYEIGGVACMAEQQSAALELGLRWGFPFAAIIFALMSPAFARGAGAVLSRIGRSRCLSFCGRCLGCCRNQEPVRLGAVLEDLGRKCSSMDLWATLEVIARACCSYFLNILVSNGLLLLTCIPSPNGRYTVQAFPHLECPIGASTDTQEFYSLLAPCLIYASVFVLAVPLTVNVMAFRQVVAEMARTGRTGRGRWGNFCGRFRDSHVHWVIVVVAKDLLVNVLVTVLVAVPTASRILVVVLASGYGLSAFWEKPFRHLLSNMIEGWTSLCLASIALLLGFGMEDAVKDVLLILAFALALSGPVLLLGIQGLALCARTSWLVPRILQPRTALWKAERSHIIRQGLAHMRPETMLERMDDIEVHLLETHLGVCAGLWDMREAADLQAGHGNPTVSRLRSQHELLQRPSFVESSVAVVPAAPQGSTQAPTSTIGKGALEDSKAAVPGSPNERDSLLLEDVE